MAKSVNPVVSRTLAAYSQGASLLLVLAASATVADRRRGITLRITQDSAIGEHDFGQTPCGSARFRGMHVDCDYVPRPERVLIPAGKPKRLGTAAFGRPIDDLAIGVLGVEFDQAMRIGPGKFRHRYVLEFGHLI